MTSPLLSVRNLRVSLRGPDGPQPVVENLSFDLEAGEILGLAGESGCGKTVTALALMGLLPGAVADVRSDRMRLGDQDLAELDLRSRRRLLGTSMAMIFQDPATALDPVFTIGWQIAQAVRRCRRQSAAAARATAAKALEKVGFNETGRTLNAYPHELSGGMRQLAVIAMAVAVRPALLLADEPTTALDVTTQARVLMELEKLRDRDGCGILLISHDLGVIAQTAERIMIMYCGRLVERAACHALFSQPRHPYTAGLLAAMPRLDTPAGRYAKSIPGRVPPPGHAVAGCAFAPRCDRAGDDCRLAPPALTVRNGTEAACLHPL